MFKFLILILISTTLQAADTSIFEIKGEKVTFHNYPKARVTISKECKSLDANSLCKELQFLKEVSLSRAGLKGTGGVNPSSVICTKTLGGEVIIGYDKNKNENSFCLTKDGLYVDGGTITYYALQNEGIKQPPRGKKPPKKK